MKRMISKSIFLTLAATLFISSSLPADTSEVYRFWSDLNGSHFFTINKNEKDNIIANYSTDVWNYEGVAWKAYEDGNQPIGTKPIYRFWSDMGGSHFFTIDENEKDYIISSFSDDVWRYEGVAYYAYEEGDQPVDTKPIYRFWSDIGGSHFFTIDENEKDYIISNYSDEVWRYEGISWYAFGGDSAQPPTTDNATVLAANDLGMHCMDKDFSVFSILPPFNVINAQVVKRDSNGRPFLADEVDVEVFYGEVGDASGSTNSYSIGKTEFWQYANSLFGVNIQEGEGLTGLYMPGDDPQSRGQQPMEFNLHKDLFSAEGIPITPADDNFLNNPYPLMRISAFDAQSGQELDHLDVVVPVATETDCQNCHKTGAIAADDPGIIWSMAPDLEIQSKINILKLHDADIGSNLEVSQPVLCAKCHYSPALDLAGTGPAGDQVGKPNFSNVMHEYHGKLDDNGVPVFPPNAPVEDTCYQCHPGNITQCQRGAMKTGRMECNDCHGDMLAVGGAFPLLPGGSIDGNNDGNPRRPWKDLPLCQSCHTGDALNYLSGPTLVADPNWPFRLRQAYQTGDDSASPLLALNKRFAEDTNSLFRFSKGHGEIACEGCHGSTHAIWPNATASANDNQAAKMLQGHIGTIIECNVCHESGSLPRTINGPHGLHNVNDSRWYDDGHEDFYESNKNKCKACHGQDLTGTPLSKMPTVRNFKIEDNTVSYIKGDLVRCDRCHGIPSLE